MEHDINYDIFITRDRELRADAERFRRVPHASRRASTLPRPHRRVTTYGLDLNEPLNGAPRR